jgi:CRP/FNR family transcriptional regulator
VKTEDLAGFQIFDGLSSKELEAVLACGFECSYPREDVIIQESAFSTDLFVILSGRVSVEVDARYFDQSRRRQIVLLRPGDIFGEIGFLEGKRRSAHVIATDSVRLVRFDADKLSRLFSRDSRTGYVFMKNLGLILARRLLDANFRWRDEIV